MTQYIYSALFQYLNVFNIVQNQTNMKYSTGNTKLLQETHPKTHKFALFSTRENSTWACTWNGLKLPSLAILETYKLPSLGLLLHRFGSLWRTTKQWEKIKFWNEPKLPPNLFKRGHNPNPNSQPRGFNNTYFNSNLHLLIHWFVQRLTPLSRGFTFWAC